MPRRPALVLAAHRDRIREAARGHAQPDAGWATHSELAGVASTAKLEFVRSLGADHVIDYTKVDYTRTGERYDWIIDTDSHHSVLAVRRALTSGGVYVTLGGSTSSLLQSFFVAPVVSAASGKSVGMLLWWKPFKVDDVETLKELIAAGKVRPRDRSELPVEPGRGRAPPCGRGSCAGQGGHPRC